MEIIHKYYPDNKNDMDFWIEQPERMLELLDSYETMLEQKDRDALYIEIEDENNG